MQLAARQLYKDGSKVTTIRSLSADRKLLTYANCWVDSNGKSEVRSTQVLERVADHPSAKAQKAADRDSSSQLRAGDAGQGDEAGGEAEAPSALKALHDFVSGYDTPPGGYATPVEILKRRGCNDDMWERCQGTDV